MGVVIKRADGTTWQASDPAKICKGCNGLKPLSAYTKSPGMKGGLNSKCKVCVGVIQKAWLASNPEKRLKKREHNKAWYAANLDTARAGLRSARKKRLTQDPDYEREWRLKYKYGLTLTGWQSLFEAQGSQCAICKSAKPHRKKGSWHTDHNHVTGKVRGILCSHCNFMLGSSFDDTEILRQAIEYLSHRSKPVLAEG